MKKIFFTLQISIIGLFALAQDFQGTVKYEIKYAGSSVEQFATMLPNFYSLQISNKFSKFSMQGGMAASFMGDVITDLKNSVTYMLMPAQKTAYKIAFDEKEAKESKESLKPKVTNTGQTETINGYKSSKYKLETEHEGETIVTYIWASKDLKVKMPKTKNSTVPIKAYDGIDGFPVKIVQDMNQMGMSFTTTITLADVKEEKLSDDQFKVPADYKIQEGAPDFSKMMGR